MWLFHSKMSKATEESLASFQLTGRAAQSLSVTCVAGENSGAAATLWVVGEKGVGGGRKKKRNAKETNGKRNVAKQKPSQSPRVTTQAEL